MSAKKENSMIRFFLLAGSVWLVSKLVKLLLRKMTQPSDRDPRRPKYGFKQSQPSQPQMEFKDVHDAEFEDIPEKEKVQK